MNNTEALTICLWFDNQAEEAAIFYTSIFRDAALGSIVRMGGEDAPVMTVAFQLNSMNFLALNGNKNQAFNETISVQILCKTQEEINHYWELLSAGGMESRCGWLKDKFGVSWQIVPTILPQLFAIPDPNRKQEGIAAMMQMNKFEIKELQQFLY